MIPLYDPKAVKILRDTFWSSKGWKPHPHCTPPGDLTYAIRKGVMFPPALFPHDAALRRLRALCEAIRPGQVGAAFLASLGSRELALRSALGSFSVGRFRRDHAFVSDGHVKYCKHCGLLPAPDPADANELSVLNFERLKWGGVRHTRIGYEIFDLEEFQKLAPAEPSVEDVAILRCILAAIRTLPADAKITHLEKAISKGVVLSDKSERRQLLQILAYCGVLSYPGYGNYFDDSKPPKNRPYRDSEWEAPAMQWRAEDGYNVDALTEYFPQHASTLATA